MFLLPYIYIYLKFFTFWKIHHILNTIIISYKLYYLGFKCNAVIEFQNLLNKVTNKKGKLFKEKKLKDKLNITCNHI